MMWTLSSECSHRNIDLNGQSNAKQIFIKKAPIVNKRGFLFKIKN